MAQSVFAAEGTQFIDAVDQAFAPVGSWTLGAEFLGQSKAFVRRCLGRFNAFGTAQSGRPLQASDTVLAAELLLTVTAVAGPSGWPGRVERISRADWDYTTANWNRCRTGSNWTTGGGEVGTPPAPVTLTSPAFGGEQVIGGLAAFVSDALALRGGLVLLRVRADDEAPPQSQWCAYGAGLSSPARPRLRVTYAEAEPAAAAEPASVLRAVAHASACEAEHGEPAAQPHRAEAAEGSGGGGA